MDPAKSDLEAALEDKDIRCWVPPLGYIRLLKIEDSESVCTWTFSHLCAERIEIFTPINIFHSGKILKSIYDYRHLVLNPGDVLNIRYNLEK